jgi:formylglycine-generating enzyme required for sulfatase activity
MRSSANGGKLKGFSAMLISPLPRPGLPFGVERPGSDVVNATPSFSSPARHGIIARWFVAAAVGLTSAFNFAAHPGIEDASKGVAAKTTAGARAHDNHVIADLGLELIWVAPGTFMMGSANDEPDRNKAEGPRTQVTLTKGYWLGRTEVTQAQYEAINGVNPSTFKTVGAQAPVERVSWLDAMAFCRQLTERERAAKRLPDGYAYTLPTEAQWEYACRAGTTDAYSGEPNGMAWCNGNSGDTTHPVGLKQPNAWGFHDMLGNVLEWCHDWYGPYSGGAAADPAGPGRGHYRTARGGSWRTDAPLGRSAARSGGSAGRLDYTIGFRVALTAIDTR